MPALYLFFITHTHTHTQTNPCLIFMHGAFCHMTPIPRRRTVSFTVGLNRGCYITLPVTKSNVLATITNSGNRSVMLCFIYIIWKMLEETGISVGAGCQINRCLHVYILHPYQSAASENIYVRERLNSIKYCNQLLYP